MVLNSRRKVRTNHVCLLYLGGKKRNGVELWKELTIRTNLCDILLVCRGEPTTRPTTLRSITLTTKNGRFIALVFDHLQ